MKARLATLLAVVGALLLATPALAQSSTGPCHFVLGFKALYTMDPADIGVCVDDQAYAANGDAQQHTSNGLLVWRKADNWTAFTNGYWTWINGPHGLVQRLNTQRFTWEANPDRLPLADAVAQAVPPISVRQPQANDLVGDPVLVAGIGTGFEGGIVARVLDGAGHELVRQSIHAGGTGILGNFAVSLPIGQVPRTPQGMLEVFEPSPKGDGTVLNMVRVPIIFGPTLISPFHGFAQYTVQPGDTLRSIAQRWYGAAGAWQRLADANPSALGAIGTLSSGQVLRIPQ